VIVVGPPESIGLTSQEQEQAQSACTQDINNLLLARPWLTPLDVEVFCRAWKLGAEWGGRTCYSKAALRVQQGSLVGVSSSANISSACSYQSRTFEEIMGDESTAKIISRHVEVVRILEEKMEAGEPWPGDFEFKDIERVS